MLGIIVQGDRVPLERLVQQYKDALDDQVVIGWHAILESMENADATKRCQRGIVIVNADEVPSGYDDLGEVRLFVYTLASKAKEALQKIIKCDSTRVAVVRLSHQKEPEATETLLSASNWFTAQHPVWTVLSAIGISPPKPDPNCFYVCTYSRVMGSDEADTAEYKARKHAGFCYSKNNYSYALLEVRADAVGFQRLFARDGSPGPDERKQLFARIAKDWQTHVQRLRSNLPADLARDAVVVLLGTETHKCDNTWVQMPSHIVDMARQLLIDNGVHAGSIHVKHPGISARILEALRARVCTAMTCDADKPSGEHDTPLCQHCTFDRSANVHTFGTCSKCEHLRNADKPKKMFSVSDQF